MDRLTSFWSGLSRKGRIGVVVVAVLALGGVANAMESDPGSGDGTEIAADTVGGGETETTTAVTTTTPEPTTTPAPPTTVASTTTSTRPSTTTTTTTTSTTTTTTTTLAPSTTSSLNCHPSYSPCVPIVSDVDCIGGSGNGPYYVGRVSVIGSDPYGLDRDNDGIGCDNDPPHRP